MLELHNLKMKNKIALLCILSIVFSTIIIGKITYDKAAKTIINNVSASDNETIQQSAKYINARLDNIVKQVQHIYINNEFKNFSWNLKYNKDFNYALEFSRIEPLLTQIQIQDQYIQSILLNTSKGVFYSLNSTLSKNHQNEIEFYIDKIKENGLIYWGQIRKDRVFNYSNHIIPIVFPILNYEYKLSEDNLIILSLNSNIIEDNIESIASKLNGEIFVLDGHNNLILSSDNNYKDIFNHSLCKGYIKDNNNMDYYTFKWKNELWFLNKAVIDINNWKIVSIQKEKDLTDDVNEIKKLIIIIIIPLIIFFIIVSIIISSTITRPLQKLGQLMKQVEKGEFGEKFSAKYSDEVSELGNSFDEMSNKIELLISQLSNEKERFKQEQILKRKAELKALQAQINPHFLYNTLDSMYWYSMMNKNAKIGEVALALSNLFRMGLNKGEEITNVFNEIEHVRNYLEIQKIIYEDVFDYTIEADEDLYNHRIIKIILQPLVENSILHGFRDIEKNGFIRISVYKQKDELVFEVSDNGCGFNQDSIVRNNINNTNNINNGYALFNVFERLRIHYGNYFSYEISSVPFDETKITVKIWRGYNVRAIDS